MGKTNDDDSVGLETQEALDAFDGLLSDTLTNLLAVYTPSSASTAPTTWRLEEAVRYAVLGGGKRFRARLLVATALAAAPPNVVAQPLTSTSKGVATLSDLCADLPRPDANGTNAHGTDAHGATHTNQALRLALSSLASLTRAHSIDSTQPNPQNSDRWSVVLSDLLRVAMAMEMIHAYSLVHDDLPCMDNADTRRGRPSTHRAYGETMALLAGDWLQSSAFALAMSVQILDAQRVGRILCHGAMRMAHGQAREWDIAQRNPSQRSPQRPSLHHEPNAPFLMTVHSQAPHAANSTTSTTSTTCATCATESYEEHVAMMADKTGALIEASCLLGGLVHDDINVQTHIQTIGRALGMAFQLADDIDDASQPNETANIVYMLGRSKTTDLLHATLETCLTTIQRLPGRTLALTQMVNTLRR